MAGSGQNSLGRRHLHQCRNWYGAHGMSIAEFGALYFYINRTDFGRAREATREDAGAVAMRRTNRQETGCVRARLGPWRGAGGVLAGAIMRMFFYIYTHVRARSLRAEFPMSRWRSADFGQRCGACREAIIVGIEKTPQRLDL